MTKAKNLYDVWTDGSYRSDSAVGGIAWLIVHDGSKASHMMPIPKLAKTARPRGSDIAELMAVGGALANIPSGSTVHLRMDAQNIIDGLKTGRLGGASSIPELQSAFQKAIEGMQKMSSVEITKVSGKHNENLNEVNALAREASGRAARAQVPS